MISTQSLLQGYEVKIVKTRRTERSDLIDLFLNELNPPRIVSGLKPLKIPFLSYFFSMRKMGVPQIYQFYQDCKRANNFSSYFWYMTDIKKHR